jgi:HAD superfamily hydrolase (TIGR01549 family)
MRTADGRFRTIRNLIWDVDGTLFDTYPAIARAFRAALRDFGHDTSLERIVALARESLALCTTTLAEERDLDQARFEEAVARQYETTRAADQPLFPGAKAICERICEGGGQNVIVTHRGPRGTAELLAANGLSGLFSGFVTRADAYPRKPDPASFNAVIERHGLIRAETMSIGDRDIDVLAGRAAGVVTCFFGRTNAGVDADLVITEFGELAGLLFPADTRSGALQTSTRL